MKIITDVIVFKFFLHYWNFIKIIDNFYLVLYIIISFNIMGGQYYKELVYLCQELFKVIISDLRNFIFKSTLKKF